MSMLQTIVQRREPVLLLGDSGTRKTSMVELIIRDLEGQAFLIHAEKHRYRKHKLNWNLDEDLPVSPVRCVGFNRRDIESYADNFLIPRLEDNILVIEDIKELYSRGESRRKKLIIDAMLSKVRYLVLATTQDISDDTTYETIRHFPNVIMFSLRVLDNLAKLTSSRAFYKEIDRRRTILEDGYCIFVRPTQALISEKSYHWDDIDSVKKFLSEGIHSIGCYSPRDRTDIKKKDPHRESRYVEISKKFLQDPSLTYQNIADDIGIDSGTVGALIVRCRNKEYLPREPKENWTVESIRKCLILKGVEV